MKTIINYIDNGKINKTYGEIKIVGLPIGINVQIMEVKLNPYKEIYNYILVPTGFFFATGECGLTKDFFNYINLYGDRYLINSLKNDVKINRDIAFI